MAGMISSPARSFHFALAWAILSVATSQGAEANPGLDWPQFLGPQRNGVYLGTNLATTWPKNGPAVVWRKEVGQGFSGPAVAAGKLILFHRLQDQEVVQCLDPGSGQSLWKFEYPTKYRDDFGFDEGPRATPLIAGNRVYTFGALGLLHCLNLADGRLVWSVDTEAEFGAPKGFFGMACSPLLEGRALLLNVGGKDGAGIVALDKETGSLLWKATDAEASYSSPVSATLGSKRYTFFFNREGLVALDPASGKVSFEFPWRPPLNASVNAATPLVVGNRIFLSASYGRGAVLLEFDPAKPKPIWAGDNILSNHYSTSVHHRGFLYGFDGRQEQGAILRCVELDSGKIRWSEDGLGAGTVLVAQDHLLVLTEQGRLICAPATPDGFHPSAQAQILGLQTRAYPALAQGRFYARSKRQLVCLDLRKEAPQVP
jgi:outer membrane protein assembly factor BamB